MQWTYRETTLTQEKPLAPFVDQATGRTYNSLASWLNEYGLGGWELASLIRMDRGGDAMQFVVIFKRALG